MRSSVPLSQRQKHRALRFASPRLLVLLALLVICEALLATNGVSTTASSTNASGVNERPGTVAGLPNEHGSLQPGAGVPRTSRGVAINETAGSLFNLFAPLPLGNYPNITVGLGANTTIPPDVVPTSTTSINVSASTSFKGTFHASPATGVIYVTNAHPAGTHTVTVKGFNSGVVTSTKTFTLTVQSGAACTGVSFTNAATISKYAKSIAVGDFNNDGKQDLAMATWGAVGVLIRLGDGAGGFTNKPDVFVDDSWALAIGDFNGDGNQDLAVVNDSSNVVSIRLGDGTGGFPTAKPDVGADYHPQSVAVGDFNNDGKQDLAIANWRELHNAWGMAGAVTIRLGVGDGTFTNMPSVQVGDFATYLRVADFNNDGKQDLAVVTQLSHSVSILLGVGNGTFNAAAGVGANSPQWIALGDFNNDAKQDLAVFSYNPVAIRLGNGLGGFGDPIDVGTGISPYLGAVADINNDGNQDILAVMNHQDQVTIRTGDGAGGFSATAPITVGDSPHTVVIGNFNGDGKLDLAVATNNFNVSIRLGECNNVPVLTPATGLSRPTGSRMVNSTIATVTDDGGNGNVSVSLTSANPSNGVTLSNIVNTGGTITANIRTDCNATQATFTLQASDGNSTVTATITVNIAPYTPPTLTYDNQTVSPNGSIVVNPNAVSAGFYAFHVNAIPALTTPPTVDGNGVVTINNAAPSGTHLIQVLGYSCDGLTQAFSTEGLFQLEVQLPPAPVLGAYPNTTVALGGNATVTPDAVPTNTTSITVASPKLKGTFAADPATGKVFVTDAHPAGVHTVTVTAFNQNLVTSTRTFELTVQTGTACVGVRQFTNAADLSVGDGPRSVVVADFDNNGKQDLAIVNYTSNTVSIRMGNGASGFDGTAAIGVGNNPSSVAVGDFNGDGRQDLAVANSGSNTVSILQGNGAGGFTRLMPDVTVGTSPTSILATDANGDGRQDLAVANSGSNSVSILLGDGAGGFVRVSTDLNSGPGTTSMAILNATDSLFVSNGAIFLGFGSNPSRISPDVNASGHSIASGDFNNDSMQDLAFLNTSSTLIRLGAGGFTFSSAPQLNRGGSSIAIGDLDNDGKVELALTNPDSATVSIIKGNGAGGFARVPPDLSVGTNPKALATGDFNGDGKLDLAVANDGSDNVSILLGGGCSPAPTITPATGLSRPRGTPASNFTIATVADDGGTDNISFSLTSANSINGVTLSNIVKTGGTITADIATDCGDYGVTSVSFALAASDGNATGTATLTINVTTNPGPTLSYNNQEVFLNGSLNVNPTTGPTDNGSVSDIRFQSRGAYNGGFNFFLNKDTGVVSFSSATPVGTHTIEIVASDQCNERSVATFDLVVKGVGTYPNTTVTLGANATITPDVGALRDASVSVSSTTNFKGTFAADPTTGVVRVTNAHPAGNYPVTVTVFNNGSQIMSRTFSLTVEPGPGCPGAVFYRDVADVNAGANPSSIAIGDFNNDGIQDLAAANSGASTVSIRMGNGTGGFVGTTEVSAGNPRSVAVGDFNGDGKQDLAVGISSSHVLILLGNGLGNFTVLPTPVSVASTPTAVATGDFNNDGKRDLAVAYVIGFTGKAAILLGDGAGGFSGTPEVGVGYVPVSIAVGDFNNDGKQDLATANANSSSVSIRLGNGAGGLSGTTEVGVWSFPKSVAIGDFNGDGKQDLAAANPFSNNVSIRLGNGTGGFGSTHDFGSTDVGVGSDPRSVAVGDFNNDGKQDFVAANHGGTISLRLGNGNGTFSGTANVGVGNNPEAVAIGDFNGDGRQDISLVKGHPDNNFSIVLGRCNTEPLIYAATGVSRQKGSIPGNSTIATVTDDGGDGNVTVAVTSANPSNGVTISNITNTNGTIKADIATECAATNATFILEASDGSEGNSTKTDTLTVNVTANTAPTLTYSNQTVAFAASLGINPTTAPADNGTLSFGVQSKGTYTGGISVGPAGVVSISNAAPIGTHTITIRATDTCGDFTDASFTLTVSKSNQTITVGTHAPVSAAYNGTFTVAAASSSGLPVTYSSEGVCSNNGATFTMNNGTGTCTVKYGQPGDGNYNAAPPVAESVTAQKLDQTVTVGTHAPASPPYLSTFTVAATSSSGLPVAFSSAGVCGNSVATFTVNASSGLCTVMYDQAGNGNYNAAPQVIEEVYAVKADQTITVTTHAPATAVFHTSFTVAATTSSGLPIVYNALGACTNVGATFTMNSGSGDCKVRYYSGFDTNQNYNDAPMIEEVVTAQKATQTISIGTHAPSSAAFKSSFTVSGTSSSSLVVSYDSSGGCANSGATFTMSSGTIACTVHYNQAGDDNYGGTTRTESVTAQKINQTITVNPHAPANAANNSSFTVAATANSSLPVTYSGEGSCTNSGAVFTMNSGTGTCSVKYNHPGDDDYKAAPQITETVNAQKGDQTITFDPLVDKSVSDADFNVSATASSNLSVSFAATGQCTVNSGTIHLNGAGSCTIIAKQAGNSNYNAATDVSRAFRILSPANVSGKKTAGGSFASGGAMTYTITLNNSSATAQLDNSGDEFTDVLPSGLTLISATATSGTAVDAGANKVTWNGSIPGGGSVTITITATVNAAPGSTISNQGTIKYDADGDGANEATALTDDPAVGGLSDTTSFAVCGASLVVTTNADSGAGSLRQAILDACPGATIAFDMAKVTSPITLTTTLPAIEKSLTIQGPGLGQLTITGNNTFRIFNVTVASPGLVSFSGLTISRGSGSNPGGDGGGINHQGTGDVNVTNCKLSDNQLTNSAGAALSNSGSGKLNVTTCTIIDNTTPGGGGAAINNTSGGTVTVSGSTLSNNSAGIGGAILNHSGGTINLSNTTLSHNSAVSNGKAGGIHNEGVLNIVNSTITDNSAKDCGGLCNENAGTVRLRNSIVAGNTATGLAADLAGSPFTSLGHNLIGIFDSSLYSGFTNGLNGDKVGTIAAPIDSRLGPLANNGGTTLTHAFNPGSPAVNGGDDCVTEATHCGDPNTPQLNTDQRGGSRKLGTHVDIGAFEAVKQPPTLTNNTGMTVNQSSAGSSISSAMLKVSDPDNPDVQLVYTLGTVPTRGTLQRNGVVLAGGGTFTQEDINNSLLKYSHHGSETITDNFSFTVSDGEAGSIGSTNFPITIIVVNDAPDAVDDALSNVAEDSGMRTIPIASLLGNDSKGPADENSQTLSFALVGLSAAGGSVTSDGTNVYFTPTADYNGPASFQYQITDNGTTNGLPDPKSDTATVSFTVSGVNDAPTAVNDVLTNIAEDSAPRSVPFADLTGNDSKGAANESGQSLVVISANNAVGGTVVLVSGFVVFTPTADYSGPASFSYAVEDNGTTNGVADPKTSGSGAVQFNITEVNDSPTSVNDALPNVAENSGERSIAFTELTANDLKGPADESGQTVIVNTVGNPIGVTVSMVGGTVRITPMADYSGAASFQYTVRDNGNTNALADPKTSGPATVSFTITEINDAPTAGNDTIPNSVEDSGPRTITAATLTANDSKGLANESGQTLIVKTVGNAVGGTVSIVGGNVIFTATANYFGPASFDYTVEDNGTTNGVAAPLSSGIATASFTITEVNDAPTAVNDGLGNMEEDAPQRTLPFNLLTDNDSKGPANESGQTLIVKTVSNAVGLTVSIVAGTVRFTPLPDYYGPASFKYTVEDNGTTNGAADPKTSAQALAHFNITEVNDTPTAVNDTLPGIPEDAGPQNIPFAMLMANDSTGPANESGQTLIVKTVSNPVGGTVSIDSGNVVFTPTPDFNGAASFDYTVEDDGMTNGSADPKSCAAATVTFANSAVADTPSVTNATTNANTQTTSGLVISRNSADGAEVTHFKITGIAHGLLFKTDGFTPINNGNFITFAEGNAGLKFTPGTTNGSFTAQASLNATETGLGGGTATATISINALGGVVRFSSANYSVAEGAGFKTITVERTGDTSQSMMVDYASTDHSTLAESVPCNSPGAGLASSRCDFTTAIGTVRFAAGETSKTFDVLISQDNYAEGPEALDLTLSNLTNGAVFGVPQTATLEITDDVSEPATNPIDNSRDFVIQQYHDILGREPDAAGLAFWTDNIEKCNDPARRPAGQTVAQCIDKQRESTAIAFFMSPEFQMTGGFVYHLYKGSLTGPPNYDGGSPNSSPGRFPNFLEFIHDMNQVSEGIVVGNQISGAVVEANRNALAAAFVERAAFVAKYGGLNDTLYVQELFNTTGITPTAAEQQALVNGLTNHTETRASVLRKVVDGTVVINEGNVQFTTAYGQAFINQENRRLFVYLEYVGYLRRNPDTAGFVFWLGKLNSFNGDPLQAEMVRSFLLSPEYRSRFGQP